MTGGSDKSKISAKGVKGGMVTRRWVGVEKGKRKLPERKKTAKGCGSGWTKRVIYGSAKTWGERAEGPPHSPWEKKGWETHPYRMR